MELDTGHPSPHLLSDKIIQDGKLYIINLLEISDTQENRSRREGEEGRGNTIKS